MWETSCCNVPLVSWLATYCTCVPHHKQARGYQGAQLVPLPGRREEEGVPSSLVRPFRLFLFAFCRQESSRLRASIQHPSRATLSPLSCGHSFSDGSNNQDIPNVVLCPIIGSVGLLPHHAMSDKGDSFVYFIDDDDDDASDLASADPDIARTKESLHYDCDDVPELRDILTETGDSLQQALQDSHFDRKSTPAYLFEDLATTFSTHHSLSNAEASVPNTLPGGSSEPQAFEYTASSTSPLPAAAAGVADEQSRPVWNDSGIAEPAAVG